MSEPTLRSVADEVALKLSLKVQEFCGKGAFKETFRIEKVDGSIAALKIVDREKISEVRTDREIEALARCQSPLIAKLIDRFTHRSEDGKVYDIVIEEFLDGGSLYDKVQNQSFEPGNIVGLQSGL